MQPGSIWEGILEAVVLDWVLEREQEFSKWRAAKGRGRIMWKGPVGWDVLSEPLRQLRGARLTRLGGVRSLCGVAGGEHHPGRVEPFHSPRVSSTVPAPRPLLTLHSYTNWAPIKSVIRVNWLPAGPRQPPSTWGCHWRAIHHSSSLEPLMADGRGTGSTGSEAGGRQETPSWVWRLRCPQPAWAIPMESSPCSSLPPRPWAPLSQRHS